MKTKQLISTINQNFKEGRRLGAIVCINREINNRLRERQEKPCDLRELKDLVDRNWEKKGNQLPGGRIVETLIKNRWLKFRKGKT